MHLNWIMFNYSVKTFRSKTAVVLQPLSFPECPKANVGQVPGNNLSNKLAKGQ